MKRDRVVFTGGPPHEVVRAYLDSGPGSSVERVEERPEAAPGDELVRLKSARVRSDGVVNEEVDIREPIEVEVDVEYSHQLAQDDRRPSVDLHVTNDFNNRASWTSPPSEGMVRAVCRIPGNFLAEGRHIVLVAIGTYSPTQVHALDADTVSFRVVDRSAGDGVRGETPTRGQASYGRCSAVRSVTAVK